MSLDAAIRVVDLHKSFVVQHRAAGTLKRAAVEGVKRMLRPSPREVKEVLKGLNLSIGKGETVALVGRNGSGKSTFLSLIARVYRPSRGSIFIDGRLAPLLELGAGFHPDLTGVENLEFYGAILGMGRRELEEKFESIVDFAFDAPDLREKIDTPLRNYSDGMKMRLGFSMSIHTDPDILVVDEVLAVGDEAFQQKCYRTIREFQERGRTILFVSHDMRAVEQVAHRVVWLHHGEVRMDGAPSEVVPVYLEAAGDADFSGL
jgi:ABC-type polysaccharide/polyol phosphate transport system ATPase subunit